MRIIVNRRSYVALRSILVRLSGLVRCEYDRTLEKQKAIRPTKFGLIIYTKKYHNNELNVGERDYAHGNEEDKEKHNNVVAEHVD
jgi:hypothetical protein